MPGIFKGVKPPPGIKKQDRLETSLGPMINSKKLYVREEMTELVDEVFEHPKPRHDDILDALYYADYYARPPRSKKIKMDDLDAELETLNNRPMSKVYNWITGAKI
jgi:hypothetical protein